MKRSVAIIGMALACAIGFFGLNYLNTPKPFNPDSIPDVVEHLTGVPGNAAVATVDGREITAEEYLYWAGYAMENVEYYYGAMDWTSEEGTAILEQMKSSALETSQLYAVVSAMAEELDCGFTEENQAEYDADWASLVEQLGSEKAAKTWLLQVGLTGDGFLKVNRPAYLYQNLLDSRADTAPATAEEMADYIAENDILKAKHILLMTIDPETREALSEEEQAEKKAAAEKVLTLLEDSEEPLELFDALMKEYSEDSGLETNPDGYLFTANEMVTEFEQGTRELDYNEISGIVESPYGYHIILRLDPADEAFSADLGQLLGESEAQEQVETMLSDRMAVANLETNEVYDSLDVAAYYANLKALREEIAAQNAEVE